MIDPAVPEIERLRTIEEILKTRVLNQKANDVCWRDVYVELGELCGAAFDPELPPEGEFVDVNCRHFYRCLASGQPYR